MGNILNASSLNLSNQGLTVIPDYVFSCKNLKSLNLSNNKLVQIPIELSGLKTLKKLDLSNNSIKQVFARTFDLNQLEMLNLNNNRLKNLPKQLGNLTKLKSLHLAGNELEILPDEVHNLIHLRTLNISDNKFQEFPKSILDLKAIVRLWIGKNEFSSIPIQDINQSFPNLKAIYCFNPILTDYDIDNSTAIISKQKGNAMKDLKLMTYNLTDTSEKNKKPSKIVNANKFIFISYSHLDEEYFHEVIKTLNGLQNIFPNLEVDVWSDKKLSSGDDWKKEISKALDRSEIAILLMSRNFISSKFIMNDELPVLLRNSNERGTTILNLIVGQCITNDIISRYQAVNSPNKPLKSLTSHEQDVVYMKLAEDIKRHLSS